MMGFEDSGNMIMNVTNCMVIVGPLLRVKRIKCPQLYLEDGGWQPFGPLHNYGPFLHMKQTMSLVGGKYRDVLDLSCLI